MLSWAELAYVCLGLLTLASHGATGEHVILSSTAGLLCPEVLRGSQAILIRFPGTPHSPRPLSNAAFPFTGIHVSPPGLSSVPG